jgi:hypothetical protein
MTASAARVSKGHEVAAMMRLMWLTVAKALIQSYFLAKM